MAVKLFAETIAQSREALGRHPHCEVLAFNVAGRDMRRLPAYYLTRYGYYLGRGIAARGILRADVCYRIGLVDDAVRRLLAERIAHRVSVVQKAIGGNLRRSDHATT